MRLRLLPLFPSLFRSTMRRWLLLCAAFLLLNLPRWAGAHPHRPGENVPPHVHEVTGHRFVQGPWVIPLAILTMLVVFVGLPCLIIWGGMKAVQKTQARWGKPRK